MRPATYDMYFVRGSTDPKVWRLTLADTSPTEPLPFDDVRLTVSKGSTVLFRAVLGSGPGEAGCGFIGVTDSETGEVTFWPTAEQTRLVPKTKVGTTPKATYEFEVRTGALERIYLMGTVEGIGGGNDDISP